MKSGVCNVLPVRCIFPIRSVMASILAVAIIATAVRGLRFRREISARRVLGESGQNATRSDYNTMKSGVCNVLPVRCIFSIRSVMASILAVAILATTVRGLRFRREISDRRVLDERAPRLNLQGLSEVKRSAQSDATTVGVTKHLSGIWARGRIL